MLKEEAGWVQSFEFPGLKVVQMKLCEACKIKFDTHNQACIHVAKEHPKLLQIDNGDLTVVRLAQEPYNQRERTLTTRQYLLYKGEPVVAAGYQVESFAEGAAWALKELSR
jgi:hypothetical protein